MILKDTLLMGYGNPDRGDDGAAFHILRALVRKYTNQDEDLFSSDITQLTQNTHIFYSLQLLPEYADMIAGYRVVVFIDAHTGEIEEDLRLVKVFADFKYSPFTHHFSPESSLALANSLTSRHPEGWLLSIRGYEFGFNRALSAKTNDLVSRAVHILDEQFIR